MTIPIPEYFNWILGNKLQWNLNRNLYIFIQENVFENVVWKMVAILSQPQYVEHTMWADVTRSFGHYPAQLTHWGRVRHICISKLTIIGSDNGLSPGRHQAIIWTNAGILLIRTLGTNFSEIFSEICALSFKKMRLKVSSAKWRPFCLGLNVLTESKQAWNQSPHAGACAYLHLVYTTNVYHNPWGQYNTWIYNIYNS